MAKSGTKEWAEQSANVSVGCAHGCLYCYAKANAIRFKRKTAENWTTEEPAPNGSRSFKRQPGRVMLPTTHDVTRGTLDAVVAAARKLLAAGKELLIVSKPHPGLMFELTARLMSERWDARKLVTFRFTIGSYLDDTLSFWEPGAPSFSLRLAALFRVWNDGWTTSVSMEPMLERRERMVELVGMVRHFVTDSIWIGMMRNVRARLSTNGVKLDNPVVAAHVEEIEWINSTQQVLQLYTALEAHPLVKWKDSIKQVVGLPEEAVG